jgi:hypothetical protein
MHNAVGRLRRTDRAHTGFALPTPAFRSEPWPRSGASRCRRLVAPCTSDWPIDVGRAFGTADRQLHGTRRSELTADPVVDRSGVRQNGAPSPSRSRRSGAPSHQSRIVVVGRAAIPGWDASAACERSVVSPKPRDTPDRNSGPDRTQPTRHGRDGAEEPGPGGGVLRVRKRRIACADATGATGRTTHPRSRSGAQRTVPDRIRTER